MADRITCITWGAPVSGREERGLEVFNEAVGLYGRMQQEHRIESFDVALFNPNGGHLDGFMCLRGSVDQLNAVKEDEEFQRVMFDASLIVQDLSMCDGYANEGIAAQMALYEEAIAKVPQAA